MNKLNMKSSNRLEENLEKIKEIFPNCFKESIQDGVLEYRIDFDCLKQELSSSLIEGITERYNMSWPGKMESTILTNTITTNTLRPSVDESKDFFNTKNLYIEGNNFEVLKVLRETYLNKVGVIYIDPPYNTGRNILYKNDFSIDKSDFELINQDKDEDGNIIYVNRKSEGRFHTKWLNMMYPTLRIARDILKNDGIIIIAIDDNEYANLKKMCDEVFFADNYIGTITTRSNPQGRGKKNIDPIHEYHLIYAKNKLDMPELKILKRDYDKKEYWNLIRGGSNSRRHERPHRFYPMLVKADKVFMIEKEEYEKIYSNQNGFDEDHMTYLDNKYKKEGYEVIWPISTTGEEKVWQRQYDRVFKEHKTYIYSGNQIKYPVGEYSTPKSIWFDDIHSNVHYGTGYLNKLFDGVDVFDYPKSIITVRDLISMVDTEYVMDFFAGSATTADSTMRLNAIDGDERKFIMVQLPEDLEENLKFLNADEAKNTLNAIKLCEELGLPKTIPSIAKERIRRAGKLILDEEEVEDLDVGFRVLKLDSSNMKDTFYETSKIEQKSLLDMVDSVKDDRSSLDLLFQIMIELGYVLSSDIKVEKINNKELLMVEKNGLFACFDDEITIDDIKEFIKNKPDYLVLKDSSFENDSALINAKQLIEKDSPSTEFRII